MFWFFGCKMCRIIVPQPGMERGIRIHLPMQEVGLTYGLRRSHMPRSNYAHAPQLLSPRSRAREPRLRSPDTLEPVLCNDRRHHGGKPVCHSEGSPCPPQPGKAHSEPRRPVPPKIKINK